MVRSGPAIDDGVAFFGTAGGTLHALDIDSQTERWTITIGGDLRSSPVIADGVIYVGGEQGILYALDASTGAERWHSPVGNADEASPAVVDGIVYAGGNDELHALNADSGQELWSVWISFAAHNAGPRTSQPDQGPVVVGGVIYMSDGTALIALSDKEDATS
jgi:outer membrane protein assembly factor BamB